MSDQSVCNVTSRKEIGWKKPWCFHELHRIIVENDHFSMFPLLTFYDFLVQSCLVTVSGRSQSDRGCWNGERWASNDDPRRMSLSTCIEVIDGKVLGPKSSRSTWLWRDLWISWEDGQSRKHLEFFTIFHLCNVDHESNSSSRFSSHPISFLLVTLHTDWSLIIRSGVVIIKHSTIAKMRYLSMNVVVANLMIHDTFFGEMKLDTCQWSLQRKRNMRVQFNFRQNIESYLFWKQQQYCSFDH